MTAEQIVRALAAIDPAGDEGAPVCAMCDGYAPMGRPMAAPLEVGDHHPACPWRLAPQPVVGHGWGRGARSGDSIGATKKGQR